ncbi:MAG: hypothetical protein IPN49_03850 [Saprospiraceae bacterium]|nr:hypothetical protein [Saprospiraceae bacterium]MBK6565409.1 hypothetical protein [Saprospiraceae bacterium]MBK6784108.1 hypothetical protein [Saprospiraceae bacterium]MBK8080009.1 hypothetical protein [Saprospiraceae bacterium]MBK8818250.1 hypothetical protein [Saprospiraceae bacterium]
MFSTFVKASLNELIGTGAGGAGFEGVAGGEGGTDISLDGITLALPEPSGSVSVKMNSFFNE